MDALSEADAQLLGDLRACTGLNPYLGLGHRAAMAAAERLDELLVENWQLRQANLELSRARIDFRPATERPAERTIIADGLFALNRQPARFEPAEPARRRRLAFWRKP